MNYGCVFHELLTEIFSSNRINAFRKRTSIVRGLKCYFLSVCWKKQGKRGTISLFVLRDEPFIQRLRSVIILVTDHTKVRVHKKLYPFAIVDYKSIIPVVYLICVH